MDREQEELQFLGLFGICKESFSIVISWAKFFTKITLTLILPLSCIFLAHDGISSFLSNKILNNENTLDTTQVGSTTYNNLSDLISSEWTIFWLIKLAYFTFLLVFSLLSTSAVVYTIACIYTAKEITFRKVLGVVPKVWKRLIVTFLWSFSILFVYNMGLIIVLVIWALFFYMPDPGQLGLVIFMFILIVYLLGFVYLSVIWQLASVISVLEDTYGIQAMIKSKGLIKGKMGISIAIFLVVNLCLVGIQVLFEQSEVFDWSVGVVGKIGYGILSLVLLTLLFLFSLVVQTVIYFVCKSYHHENIDKSSLADHLEVYLGEYIPLNAKDIQLEQFQV